MGLDETVNGGRAEPKTEAMSSESVLAAQSTQLKSINAEEWTCRANKLDRITTLQVCGTRPTDLL